MATGCMVSTAMTHASATLLLSMLMLSLGVAVSQDYRLDLQKVLPVLEAAMKCQKLDALHVAVVQQGKEAQTLQLQISGDSVVNLTGTPKMLKIGSVSKGVFGTALPIIQQALRDKNDNQKFNLLTTPLNQLLNEDFWFLDHKQTGMVTIEDLVSHNTGLGRHDMMWLMRAANSFDDLVSKITRMTPTHRFRASFVYNNLAFSVADWVVRRLTKQTFSQYMRQHLWQPLGMMSTKSASEIVFDNDEIAKSLNNVEAAGGIVMPLSDMVKYMEYHLNNYNYSVEAPLPEYFTPVNARGNDMRLTAIYDKNNYANESLNLPDWVVGEYGYGWSKTWYRENLGYYHGGSFFGDRCELDLLVKRNLGVFTHAKLGSGTDNTVQTLFPLLINKFIIDTLLDIESFITKDNVCSLFKPMSLPPASVAIRTLTDDEINDCIGDFANFGMGTLTVRRNGTSSLLATYGIGQLELIPIQLERTSTDAVGNFFGHFLSPDVYAVDSPIIDRNDTHISVSPLSYRIQSNLVTISKAEDGKVTLSSRLIEQDVAMVKGLNPSDWKRPELCPDGGINAASKAFGVSAQLLLTLLLLLLLPVMKPAFVAA